VGSVEFQRAAQLQSRLPGGGERRMNQPLLEETASDDIGETERHQTNNGTAIYSGLGGASLQLCLSSTDGSPITERVERCWRGKVHIDVNSSCGRTWEGYFL
jgi:hypothetical protein